LSFDPSLPFQTSELVGKGARYLIVRSCRTSDSRRNSSSSRAKEYYRRPNLQLAGRTIIGKKRCVILHGSAVDGESRPHMPAGNTGPVLTHRHPLSRPTIARSLSEPDGHADHRGGVGASWPHGAVAGEAFHDINRSEKHNNWSIATDDGVVLLHPTKLNEATTHLYALVVVMAAVCLAVDEHGNLVRMAIATPRNDFRLGACKPPPCHRVHLPRRRHDGVPRGVQGRQV